MFIQITKYTQTMRPSLSMIYRIVNIVCREIDSYTLSVWTEYIMH